MWEKRSLTVPGVDVHKAPPTNPIMLTLLSEIMHQDYGNDIQLLGSRVIAIYKRATCTHNDVRECDRELGAGPFVC